MCKFYESFKDTTGDADYEGSIWRRRTHVQCDQIGRFFIFLVNFFLQNQPEYSEKILGYFK